MRSAVVRRTPVDLALFGLAAVAVYGFETWLAHRLGAMPRADLLAAAIVIDLAVVLPLAFGIAIVRRRRWPLAAVVPPAVIGLVAAGWVIPEPHRAAVEWAHLAAIPLELALVTWIGRQGWLAVRRARAASAGGDFVGAMTEAVRPHLGNRRLAAIVAYEASVLAYAFGLAPGEPSGNRAPAGPTFTHHRSSAYRAILGVVALVGAMELVGMHVLLTQVHAGLAWAVSALSLYGALWVVADFRALSRRPTRLDADALYLRLGLRWSARIPWSEIESVERYEPTSTKRPEWKLVLVGEPALRLHLREPAEAHGPYGHRRSVRRIALAVDEPARFERDVRARLDGAGA